MLQYPQIKTMGEFIVPDTVLKYITGNKIEGRINDLASISEGERIGEGGSRLGLSSKEPLARKLISGWMEQAGMRVHEHPLALIGYYEGKNRRLSPVSFGSHFDTVPAAGKYDGPAGIIGSISVVDAFNQAGIKFRRPLTVFAFTLEESSRFNSALLGSRSVTQGLTESHLSLVDSSGNTLAQAIEKLGFNTNKTRRRYFNRNPDAYIEMHIEQGPYLNDAKYDIGAVTAIAATDRERILIGNKLTSKVGLAEFTEGLRFTVNGQAGHSGGTPMGKEFRADGLIPTARFLTTAASLYRESLKSDVDLHVASVEVDDAALNKIPGRTTTTVYISGTVPSRVADACISITNIVEQLNNEFSGDAYPKFKGHSLDIEVLGSAEIAQTRFFDPEQVLPILSTAGTIILDVQEIVEQYRRDRVVGTVGTFRQSPEGLLELGLDLRGVIRNARTNALVEINKRLAGYEIDNKIALSILPLPSIHEPSIMDVELVALIERSAKMLFLSRTSIPSGPGHDAQNFVEIGVPTGMIFIPSRKGGISHNPSEYSTNKDLENGAKVLACVVAQRAT